MGSSELRNRWVKRLGQALETQGFFIVEGHAVDPILLEQAYAAAQHFFQLPAELKRRYERPLWQGQRGFTRFGQEHAKNHPVPDLKEFWHIGREADVTVPTSHLPNLWPEEIPEFRQIMLPLYQQLDCCATQLLTACALYLEIDPGVLTGMVQYSDSILRVIHYPPLSTEAPANSMRAAAHEDINLITLLCTATHSGLELLSGDGRWLPVEARSGQIIVDAGDMLQQLTNGLFQSTTHRVVNPLNPLESRLSMPFFVHPRAEVDLTPLPICLHKTGGVARFPSITAGEYLKQRLSEIGLASPKTS